MTTTVRDIMSKDVQTVLPGTTLREAATLLKTWDIGSLPVCEDKRVVGIITDRDITIRGVAEGRDPAQTRVEEVMSKNIVGVREDSDLRAAETIMKEQQLRRLPVMNADGELVGYLSLAKITRNESAEESGKVIQGVSQPKQSKPSGGRTKTA